MLTKVCIKCGVQKNLEEFYVHLGCISGRRGECKVCRREHVKKYQLDNKSAILKQKRRYRQNNKEVIAKQKKTWEQTNRIYISRQKRQYRQDNKKAISEYHKQYRQSKKEALSEYKRSYYQNNKKSIISCHKLRLQTDMQYKLAHSLRSRLGEALKGGFKSGSAVRDLGCSIRFFKEHLESQFKHGMSWKNHGEWHIDHIKPLSSFDLTDREELLKACHYTNLQPLWKGENLEKGGKTVCLL